MRRNHNVYSTAAHTRRPLSMDDLRAAAPSIFATKPFEGVSERYTFIPTFKIVESLKRAGFVPVMAGQSMFRIEGKGEYAKHIIRFQRESDISFDLRSVPESERGAAMVPEIALVNSHDRSSGYNLSSGAYRWVCNNGLITSVEDACISVRHSGDIIKEVRAASRLIIEQSLEAVSRAKQLSRIPLPRVKQLKLATKAAEVRWGTTEGGALAIPFAIEKLLEPRRWIDAAPDLARPFDTHPRFGAGTFPKEDLFTTMNVIQENIMKGGIHSRTATGRRASTRSINSVSEDIRINKRLWALAEEMA